MSSLFLQPTVFFPFLLVLFAAAVVLLFLAHRRHSLDLGRKDEALARERKAMAEMENLLAVNTEGFRQKSQALEAQLQGFETELAKASTEVETLKTEDKRLRDQMEKMFRDAKEKDDVFRREMAMKEGLAQRLTEREAECSRLR